MNGLLAIVVEPVTINPVTIEIGINDNLAVAVVVIVVGIVLTALIYYTLRNK